MSGPETAALLEALRALDWGRRQVLEVVEAIGYRSGTNDPERRRLKEAGKELAAVYERLAVVHAGLPEAPPPPDPQSRPRCSPELQQLAAELRLQGLEWAEVARRIDHQTGVVISANTARRWAQVAGEQPESLTEGEDSAS